VLGGTQRLHGVAQRSPGVAQHLHGVAQRLLLLHNVLMVKHDVFGGDTTFFWQCSRRRLLLQPYHSTVLYGVGGRCDSLRCGGETGRRESLCTVVTQRSVTMYNGLFNVMILTVWCSTFFSMSVSACRSRLSDETVTDNEGAALEI